MSKDAGTGARYRVVLFDLDGTLTDPKTGITRSVQHALRSLGILEPDLDFLQAFIGPPLAESFSRFYGFDEELAVKAIEAYRQYFTARGLYENRVYPGIRELLAELAPGTTLGVATSKPTIFAERILQHFNLATHFSFVIGSNLDNTHSGKTQIICTALASAPKCSSREVFMVGDREHDIRGAHENDVDSIAVAYGYGPIDELQRSQPTFLAHSVEELRVLLWK